MSRAEATLPSRCDQFDRKQAASLGAKSFGIFSYGTRVVHPPVSKAINGSPSDHGITYAKLPNVCIVPVNY